MAPQSGLGSGQGKRYPSLKEVPINAFNSLDNLVDIVFTKNITHIGHGALAYCSKLENVTIEDESSLRSIGEGAFADCPKCISI